MTGSSDCGTVPHDRIQAWQNDLAQIVRYIQPWWMAAEELPIWVQNYAQVRSLVSSMEKRVEELAQLILPVVTANCRAPVEDVDRIETELTALSHMAHRFDSQLRQEVPQRIFEPKFEAMALQVSA
ncbi:MAG TPA: hypothetical protein VHD56_15175 [Tepidisphaeraceae bacterium]|nr:hypothetical protein [Tepidisphaeraceae bacterium]